MDKIGDKYKLIISNELTEFAHSIGIDSKVKIILDFRLIGKIKKKKKKKKIKKKENKLKVDWIEP